MSRRPRRVCPTGRGSVRRSCRGLQCAVPHTGAGSARGSEAHAATDAALTGPLPALTADDRLLRSGLVSTSPCVSGRIAGARGPQAERTNDQGRHAEDGEQRQDLEHWDLRRRCVRWSHVPMLSASTPPPWSRGLPRCRARPGAVRLRTHRSHRGAGVHRPALVALWNHTRSGRASPPVAPGAARVPARCGDSVWWGRRQRRGLRAGHQPLRRHDRAPDLLPRALTRTDVPVGPRGGAPGRPRRPVRHTGNPVGEAPRDSHWTKERT